MRFRFLFRTLSSEERPRKSIVRRSDKSLHLSEPNGPAKIVVFAAGVEVPPRQWSGPAASVLGARATIGSASGKLPLGDARARAGTLELCSAPLLLHRDSYLSLSPTLCPVIRRILFQFLDSLPILRRDRLEETLLRPHPFLKGCSFHSPKKGPTCSRHRARPKSYP